MVKLKTKVNSGDFYTENTKVCRDFIVDFDKLIIKESFIYLEEFGYPNDYYEDLQTIEINNNILSFLLNSEEENKLKLAINIIKNEN